MKFIMIRDNEMYHLEKKNLLKIPICTRIFYKYLFHIRKKIYYNR